MSIPNRQDALARYARNMTKANWQSVIYATMADAYTLAFTVLGDAALAMRALRKAFRVVYMRGDWTGETLEIGIFQAVLLQAGKLCGMQLVGEDGTAFLYAPEGSDAFIPKAFTDDPDIRAQLLQAADGCGAPVRLAAAMLYRLGMPLSLMALILNCGETVVQNRLNTFNSAIAREVNAIREGNGFRGYSPETMAEVFGRAPIALPEGLAQLLLGATSGSFLLGILQVLQHVLNMRSVSAAQSVQSGAVGALAGGAVIGGLLVAGNLMIATALAASMFTISNDDGWLYQHSAPYGGTILGGPAETIALKDKGFVPHEISGSIQLPIVPSNSPILPTSTDSAEGIMASATIPQPAPPVPGTPPVTPVPPAQQTDIPYVPTQAPSAMPSPGPGGVLDPGKGWLPSDPSEWTPEQRRSYWGAIQRLFGELHSTCSTYMLDNAGYLDSIWSGQGSPPNSYYAAYAAVDLIRSFVIDPTYGEGDIGNLAYNPIWEQILNAVENPQGSAGYSQWADSQFSERYVDATIELREQILQITTPTPSTVP